MGKNKSSSINIDVIKESMDELMALSHSKQSAAETFSEAIDSVAEKASVSRTSLRKLIAARIKNNEASEKEDAETFIDLLEAIA